MLRIFSHFLLEYYHRKDSLCIAHVSCYYVIVAMERQKKFSRNYFGEEVYKCI